MKNNFLRYFLFFSRKNPHFRNETDVSELMIVWKKFIRRGWNVFFLTIICIFLMIAILGYLITPDKTPFANQQLLELALQKPGFRVNVLKIPRTIHKPKTHVLQLMLFGQESQFDVIPVKKYTVSQDSIFFEVFDGTEQNGQLLSKHILQVVYFLPDDVVINRIDDDYEICYQNNPIRKLSYSEVYEKLHKEHIDSYTFIMGSDRFGRDVFSMMVIGSRVSLSIGFVAVILSLFIGVLMGAVAGYFGGFVDKIILWFINVVWSIPTLFLVIAITFALGKGFWQIFIAIGLTLWVDVARVIRGMVLSLKQKEFIEAAKAQGFSDFRIVFRHILPLTLGPLVVLAASNFASAILIESGLSFLGIGVQPPTPSWGSLLRENYGFLIMDYAYLAIFPGVAISLLVLSFMVIGNGLRDAMDAQTQ